MAQYKVVTWAEENPFLALISFAFILWAIFKLVDMLTKPKTTTIVERDITDETIIPTQSFRPAVPVGSVIGSGVSRGTGSGMGFAGAGTRVGGGGSKGGAL